MRKSRRSRLAMTVISKRPDRVEATASVDPETGRLIQNELDRRIARARAWRLARVPVSPRVRRASGKRGRSAPPARPSGSASTPIPPVPRELPVSGGHGKKSAPVRAARRRCAGRR